MDEDGIGLALVPPSPVATSTQRLHQGEGSRLMNFSYRHEGFRSDIPPLPSLPDLERGIIGVDSDDDEVSIVAGPSDRSFLTGIRRPSVGLVPDNEMSTSDGDLDSDASSINSEPVEIIDDSSGVEIVSDSDDSTTTIQPQSPSNPAPVTPSDVQDVVLNEPVDEGTLNQGTTQASGVIADSTQPYASGSGFVQIASTNTSSAEPDPQSSHAGNQDNHINVQALGAGASPADFRQAKRKRVASPEKPAASDNAEEDEGECCPICFETWTTSGHHRLSSLKCGHLFGQSCIEKWLKGQGGKCPHCNAKAKRQDIRVLYAKSIKAVDTSDRDRALKDLEKEKECRRKVEMDCAQLRLQFQMAIEENNRFKLEIEKLKVQVKNYGSSGSTSGASNSMTGDSVPCNTQTQIAGQFLLDKTIKIWDGGSCRVMAYCPSLATLVASQPSSSTLFPGFGVKKISTLDFKTSQYLTIHSKAIRDLAFHPSVDDGMLLSCGLDKKVKMTSLLSNAVVQTYDTSVPAWSCVWHAEDRNYFYAGLQNGLVLEYDIRNTDGAVQEINIEGSRSPVASLCSMRKELSANFRPGGLLIGKLDQVSFYEWLPGNTTRLHYLPLSGNLTSLHVEPNTRHLLASYRPTAKNPTIRHQLCEMISNNISADPTVIDNACSCNVIHTFHGGRTQTVLSKTTLIQHPGDESRLLVCGSEETSNSVHLWDSGSGQLTQRLMMGGAAVDMCSLKINNTTYLATLTDKQCKVFKWSER